MLCMLGMFVFLAAYFGVFVYASSLLVAVKNGTLLLFAYHAFNFSMVCARMAQKGELFGFALIAHPSTLNSYILPFIGWSFYYLLTCAAPLLIASSPMELGPGIFSSLTVWSSLGNGVMIFIGLAALGKHPYLNMTNGMATYGVALLLMAVGLFLFFKNVDEGFDISLFWRRKAGKEHATNCWVDENVWEKAYKTKNEERYKGWIESIHPTYFPFDEIPLWLDDLATKYEDEQVERPEWLEGDKFVKRIVTIYHWYGKDQDRADEALVKLFGRSGKDLEVGTNGQLSYIKKQKSTILSGSLSGLLGGGSKGAGEKGNKVEPDGERDIEMGA